MSALRVPLVPEPPHDPKSLLLAGWIGPEPMRGWRLRKLVGTEVAAGRATVKLSPTPDSARRLTETNGTFGGLRLPPHMALGPEGDFYLLDRVRGTLLRFDACECRFVALPCNVRMTKEPQRCGTLADPVAGSRRRRIAIDLLASPGGIATCGNALYVADTGHARVTVYALPGIVPRAAFALPAAESAALGAPWAPSELAFDGHGNLLVLDRTHGRIDRFDAHGHWQGPKVDVPGAVHLFVDCSDAIVVVVEALVAATLPPLGTVQYAELDAGHVQTDWQALRINGITAGASFDVALATAGHPLGAAQLPQLPESEWRRFANKLTPAAEDVAMPVALDGGRYLRLRVTPLSGSSASALTVTATTARAVRIGEGSPVTLDLRADLLRARPIEAELGFDVDARGRFFVLCPDACGEPVWRAFDDRGAPLVNVVPPLRRYKREGYALTTLLDSGIDGCPWHRVELRGSIPDGCSIEVRTATAPLVLDDAEIDTLDDSAWCTRIELKAAAGDRHDCLVTSPPGRYLWLRITLRGDGLSTPCVESAVIEFPRVSLRRYLPAVFGADPAGADFTDRFTALFDATLRSLERPIDGLAKYFEPLATPVGDGTPRQDFLTWLGTWIGVATVRELPVDQRRRLLKHAASVYCLRGTSEGLWRQLLLLLGFDRALDGCRDVRPQARCIALPLNCAAPPACIPASPPPLILEHFKLRRWLFAGAGRLGDDSKVWGASIVNRSQLGTNAQIGGTQLISTPDPLRDPFHVYAHRFSVFVPARVRDCAPLARALDLLLAREKPAHTEVDVRFVGPRFTVGRQAMVGLDSVVARTPRGVPLDNNALGQGTVLTAPPGQGTAPRVGSTRVGAGTVLN